MRVIGGQFGSRPLASLRGLRLRPTTDRLRETLFNILGVSVEGALFVDVYAGTGAVGIEALSRGARLAIFIESHAAAAKLIRKNLDSLGIRQGAEILRIDALRGLQSLSARKFQADFVFLDPPYADKQEHERALDFLDSGEILRPGGHLIVEHTRRQRSPTKFARLVHTRVVEQGDAALSFYRLDKTS